MEVMGHTRWSVGFALVCLLVVGVGMAEEPPHPEARDRCPVCGMFVAKYTNWIAAVEYEDGDRVFFDGPKDMFRYLHDMETYASGRQAEDILKVWVTDYYSTRMIDAHEAFYVAGSDVMGPMGHELVPLATAEEAESFRADHAGDPPLRFAEVTPDKIPGR